MARTAQIHRETGETKIDLTLDLDGSGRATVATGVGFFDHMLTLLTRHSLIDLTVQARGDLHVDAHHTVEDVGICYGRALAQALGDKAGIRRYGDATVPMDETLVTAAIDLSGRPFCVWRADVPMETLGSFNAPLAEEFWRAVSSSGALTLHVVCHHGRNTHHIVEGIFKATARRCARRSNSIRAAAACPRPRACCERRSLKRKRRALFAYASGSDETNSTFTGLEMMPARWPSASRRRTASRPRAP